MAVTEIYPYLDIIGGMPLTHKYGFSISELTKALSQQLDSFITGTERVQADFSPDNALGPVLDSIGTLLDVTRRAGQSDATLSNIILQEVTTREQSTIDGLIAAIKNVTGMDPIIKEYPDVDFVNDYDLKKNEGAIQVTILSLKQEFFQDVVVQTDLYKAAGIAVVYNLLTEMTETFTDVITLEELFFMMLTVHSEELVTLTDALDFEMAFIESLTSITEQLGIEMAFLEELTTITDALSHEGVLYFSEDLSTLTDVFGGGAIESFFTESMPNRVARIGSAKIGAHVIGSWWYYANSSEWDVGYWDNAEWDNTIDKILVLRGVF